jgi:hypothetical protein
MNTTIKSVVHSRKLKELKPKTIFTVNNGSSYEYLALTQDEDTKRIVPKSDVEYVVVLGLRFGEVMTMRADSSVYEVGRLCCGDGDFDDDDDDDGIDD